MQRLEKYKVITILKTYIYEQDNYPNFTWQDEKLLTLLGKARYLQGRIIGKMENLGFELRNEASLETITQDVIKP